ncbi:unnamed protein product [Adineta ricciae]|uniref:Uncharacterized protein n=1 Tax=Adineta ricciae TaxID=249248 RepID=A0A815Z2U6_ADIRI|nr:unnamed protein product [Adineta ricciae]
MTTTRRVHRTTIWRHRQALRFQPVRVPLREVFRIQQHQGGLDAANLDSVSPMLDDGSPHEAISPILDDDFAQVSDDRSSSSSEDDCDEIDEQMRNDEDLLDYFSLAPPVYFFTFDLASQLQQILDCSTDLCLVNHAKNRPTTLQDIVDGEFYQRLLIAERGNNFLTLTMNVDGVSPNRSSSLSIWPVFLVINEIEKGKRFALENLIVGGIWPGPSKPSREHMFVFLTDIVEQLKVLERGQVFHVHSSCGSSRRISLKVFLTSCCCDKPAQCLVQRIAEPIAKFGCGACEIHGIYNYEGRCNTFPMTEGDRLRKRDNKRYDELLLVYESNAKELAAFIERGTRGRNKLMNKHKLSVKGIQGPCVLRSLAYFDVGSSFLVDSLHNVYLGVFRRLLNMWLSTAYQDQQWSIHGQLDKLDMMLTNVHFPSTTTRLPRSLAKFNKYKGNEFRSLLLFGYSIFNGVLGSQYYSHFLILVLIMHISESRTIQTDWMDNLRHLCTQFVLIFPRLYTVRHNVQVVHSIAHIHETVKSFGPLSNYSTFNFESLLGRKKLDIYRFTNGRH